MRIRKAKTMIRDLALWATLFSVPTVLFGQQDSRFVVPEWVIVTGNSMNGSLHETVNEWTTVLLRDGQEVQIRSMFPIARGTRICVQVTLNRTYAWRVPDPRNCAERIPVTVVD
jgi:signal peptidase I